MTLPVETLKSVPPGKAVWNANGGFVSVLLTHLFLFCLFVFVVVCLVLLSLVAAAFLANKDVYKKAGGRELGLPF